MNVYSIARNDVRRLLSCSKTALRQNHDAPIERRVFVRAPTPSNVTEMIGARLLQPPPPLVSPTFSLFASLDAAHLRTAVASHTEKNEMSQENKYSEEACFFDRIGHIEETRGSAQND